VEFHPTKNTVVSSDDEHTVARNMYRLINTLRNKNSKKNYASRWFYLQDYTGMDGQQNIMNWNVDFK
jgi:hypothetical protein